MKILGRNPTLWLAVLNAAVVLIGTVGFHWLSGQQAALAVVAINAVAAALNAWTVRPIAPAAFTYAVGAILALASSYGFNLSAETMGALNALVVASLGLLTYGNVSPVETRISRATFKNDPVVYADPDPSGPQDVPNA